MTEEGTVSNLNIEKYRRLLGQISDPVRRQTLLILIADEQERIRRACELERPVAVMAGAGAPSRGDGGPDFLAKSLARIQQWLIVS